ncbi:NAD(+)/NADH kinase [Spirochaeta thermophila]|uniref:NAD kinase n=1 Tax=Winmispira thermophila (strain ATCC 49972 / DSM 6192 / RI 19.B1) TaxID=665571 RepID=E0RS43_WINT6|nr:NAD(+)/NADH kinase [Spirochaeta thermophila]ADN01830.1 probable inorganic polyphosphate/ATP-NAD kinase [Spirochaeta thermophila DSM 6192]
MPDVVVIANLEKPRTPRILHEVEERLRGEGLSYRVLGLEGSLPEASLDGARLAISIGGDGTVLYSARLVASHGVPLLPINAGRLGFLAELGEGEWSEVFSSWKEGEALVSERLMLKATVSRGGEVVASCIGLNDAVISSSGISKIVRLSVVMHSCTMGEYHADGVIIATPTGSTAYSAAAGGPILHPEVPAFIVTPICALSLASRPVVTPSSEPVIARVHHHLRTGVLLTIDGQEVVELAPGDEVRVEDAGIRARLLLSPRWTFYDVLRTKLGWSGGPVYA